MKDCEHYKLIALVTKENGVRKSACSNASDITVHYRKALGVSRSKRNSTINFDDEILPKSKSMFSIPFGRLVEVQPSSSPKYYL